jgi:AcrR family transcriptional regulator
MRRTLREAISSLHRVARGSTSNGRGRPRDPNLDELVIEATVALLAEQGYEATTVQAISRRSGVHTSAIYRRWPNRIALIQEVTLPMFREGRFRPSGDLRRDLRRFVTAFAKQYATPAARAAIPALMAAYQADAVTAPEEWTRISLRPQFNVILDAAGPGQVDPALDRDDVFDMLLGAVLARTFAPTVATRRPPIDRTVDLAVRMLRPTD